jgi:hypothetical protein
MKLVLECPQHLHQHQHHQHQHQELGHHHRSAESLVEPRKTNLETIFPGANVIKLFTVISYEFSQ